MSESTTKTAGCLCGHISITASPMRRNFTACHCDMCRKWGGTWMAVECSSEIRFDGDDALTVYDSSSWAERGFCNKCGTHLFFRSKNENQYYIPVGLFDDGDEFVFFRQIFIDRKPDYYCFADHNLNLTSDQLAAEFSASPEDCPSMAHGDDP
jgi:hypothetical protein